MTNMRFVRYTQPWLGVLFALVVLSGCASQALQKEGVSLIEEGRYEEGLARLDEGARQSPRDPRARLTVSTQRDQVVATLLSQADRLRVTRDHEAAAQAYQRVLGIDPANARASEALRQLEKLRNVAEMLKQVGVTLRRGDLAGAERQLRPIFILDSRNEDALALKREIEELRASVAAPYPQLRTKMGQPVSLEFRDAQMKQIFEVLARTAGINFIFDKDVKADLRATLFVRQVAIEDAVELLLQQNQLGQRAINDNTIIIYPDTPQKQREYQDLVIRSFYLANTDVKSALNMVKTLLKTKDVFIDERLNVLTMRDTPDAIRLAEKLLTSQDLVEPEVVLEVEVLEIARKRILDLGIQWPSTFTALDSSLGTINLLNELKGIGSRRIGVNSGPVARINANDKDVNTLANPVLRVRSKEKAKIHIGDRIPIVSASTQPIGGGTSITTESVTYLDVGLKIDVEPTVYLNDEVGIKIVLEVSNSSSRGTTRNGSTLVEISTRNASTSLRLKDGETQVLAGLLRNDFDTTGDRIPGLGDIPGLGRLFGSNQDTISKTELILSITPRIVRNLPYLAPYETEYSSGTEGTLRLRPEGFLRQVPSEAGAKQGALKPAAILLPSVASAAQSGAANAILPPAAPVQEGAGQDGAAASPLALFWQAPETLRVGAQGVIMLRVNATQPLKSSALQLAFDPAVLKIDEVLEGDILNRGEEGTSFTARLDDESGRLFIGTSRAAESGVTGEGALLQLRVTALAANKDGAQVRLLTFSGIGEGNRLLLTPLPPTLPLVVLP